jgi:hypothetical protein
VRTGDSFCGRKPNIADRNGKHQIWPHRSDVRLESPSSCSKTDPITGNLYDEQQQSELPETAVLASLGCGNPTALAELKPGETVLDLGSGGGINVLLSARRVSPGGKPTGSI